MFININLTVKIFMKNSVLIQHIANIQDFIETVLIMIQNNVYKNVMKINKNISHMMVINGVLMLKHVVNLMKQLMVIIHINLQMISTFALQNVHMFIILINKITLNINVTVDHVRKNNYSDKVMDKNYVLNHVNIDK